MRVIDTETHRSIVLLTNNFLLDALTVGELYRSRWQVELYFKWIKQHLRIKVLYGTTFNAVSSKLWIALTTFVLVAIAKKELKLDGSVYSILQILSVTLFEKAPINEVLGAHENLICDPNDANQLTLFNL